MQWTAEHEAAIVACYHEGYRVTPFDRVAFLAGIAWGAADMRMRAASLGPSFASDSAEVNAAIAAYTSAIRALPGEAP